ncbi:MAG: allantoinase AllB [Candidatus Obscuribacterales bacterium]|nr:allantoinase AllB [Candidatus Obscuribacterales bacterium]
MNSEKTFGIRSNRVVTPEGIQRLCVIVEDGKIADLSISEERFGFEIHDVGDSVVMPGLVDCHVHLNEPGRTEWEGFETGTKAAAAGGTTTITDMPLNSNPVTTTPKALEEKLEAAQSKLEVDCAFWGGVIPGNQDSLEPLIAMGVKGFKCFLIHSGIDDFPNVTEDDLHVAMPILAKHRVPLLVHAELECADSHPEDWSDRASSYRAFLNSRPRRWENDAIDLMIRLCEQHNCPVHIVHLSSSEAIPSIQAAKAKGLPFTVETCPHYLTFAAEEITDGDPRFKCAPPIRESENREKLWDAVMDGTIDFIVSDHSPCTPSLKFLNEGNLQKAWGGISSMQFVLPAVWSQASRRGATIQQVTTWLSKNPAELLGLSDRKGRIAKGFDADFVVWNPETETRIEAAIIQHRHKVTPYDGMDLRGNVEATYVRGQLVYKTGALSNGAVGRMLLQQRVEVSK